MHDCKSCPQKAGAPGWPCPRRVLEMVNQLDGADPLYLAAIGRAASEVVASIDNADKGGLKMVELMCQQWHYYKQSLRKALAEVEVTA